MPRYKVFNNVISLNGGPVIWGVTKLVCASDFMAAIGFEQAKICVLEDNQSTVLQASGECKLGKSDHNIADIGTEQEEPIAKLERL